MDSENDVHCLVYEYVTGGSLDSILEDQGIFSTRKALDWRKCLDASISILSALKYVHSQNWPITEDLKPHNICFTEKTWRVSSTIEHLVLQS